jgi:hypothetical protein
VATFVARLRTQAGVETTVRLASGLLALSLAVLGLSDKPLIVGIALFMAGACWLAAVTTFNASVQIGAAEWVRGRAMAIYLLVFFGSIAAGSAVWGLAAEQIGVQPSFLLGSGGLALTLVLATRYLMPETDSLDLTPSRHWPMPPDSGVSDGSEGPIWVMIDYEVAPQHRQAFIEAMEDVRQLRRRDGAFRWELIQGMEATDLYHEIFVIRSWAEHLRQHERVTVADQAVEARALAFHSGKERPRVRHFVAASLKPETLSLSDRILPTQWTR